MKPPTRRQRQVMRRLHDEGLRLMAESNGECWLFAVDDTPGGTYDERYRPVERISTVLAERLVLGGWVHPAGRLTPAGLAVLTGEGD